MWKWVVRDYFAAFRWEKSKEWLKNSNGWWLVFYFSFMLPACSRIWSSSVSTKVYLMVVIPFIYGVFSVGIHDKALPKVMYLCPMEQKVRKEYIARSYLFRILMIVILNLVAAFFLLIMGLTDVVTACMIVGNGAFWAVAGIGLGRQRLDPAVKERLKATTSYAMGNMETGLGIVSALSQFGLVCILGWDTPVAWWVKWIFVGVAVVLQLPLAIRLLKNWDKTMERATSYEASYL